MKERVILLIAGESGSGKSFFVANLKNALIFDTDIGGGLAYADARIQANGSERIEAGTYLEVLEEIKRRRSSLKDITTLAIDHLTTLQQEAVIRHNPTGEDDFGRSYDRAAREWRKIREFVRVGNFTLVCTSHLKNKYEKKKVTGMTADASKNIEGDFQMVLHLDKGKFPPVARVNKWRRDPDDPRGAVPACFPLTVDCVSKIHGYPLNDARHETPMASGPQVAEIQRLISVVKLPEGMVAKWMAKAKAESWEDFTQPDIQKCIDYLTGLMKSPPPATTTGNGVQQREPGVDDE